MLPKSIIFMVQDIVKPDTSTSIFENTLKSFTAAVKNFCVTWQLFSLTDIFDFIFHETKKKKKFSLWSAFSNSIAIVTSGMAKSDRLPQPC